MIDWPESVRPFYDALQPPQQQAATVLVILNQAADPAFKSRYARRWWGILEERAKLCAMMSPDLPRFVSSVATRLGGTLGVTAALRATLATTLATIVATGAEARVLDALQHDTPVLVGFVRAVSDARRALFEEAVADPADDEPMPGPPTASPAAAPDLFA